LDDPRFRRALLRGLVAAAVIATIFTTAGVASSGEHFSAEQIAYVWAFFFILMLALALPPAWLLIKRYGKADADADLSSIARRARQASMPPIPKWHMVALALVSLGAAIAIWEPIRFKSGEVIVTTLAIFEIGRRFVLSRIRR
jgi:hypothetical protein